MNRKRAAWILLYAIPLLILLLGAYPNSVMMVYAPGPGETYIEYVSCYSMQAVGYAHWGPMLTMVSAAVILILALLDHFRPRAGLRKAMVWLSVLVILFPQLDLLLTGRTTWMMILLSLLGMVLTLAALTLNHEKAKE